MTFADALIYAGVLGAYLLAVVSPGPDFFVAVQTSLGHGRRAGVGAAIGFGLGILVHVAYSVAGIALIISQSIVAFQIIKTIGALYLIYLGYKSWKNHSGFSVFDSDQQTGQTHLPFGQAVLKGFLTNVLNPKATLFFLGLFTIMISPTTLISHQAILGLIMALNTTLWFCAVAFFFTMPHIQQGFLRFQNWFNKAFGAILIALGIKVILN